MVMPDRLFCLQWLWLYQYVWKAVKFQKENVSMARVLKNGVLVKYLHIWMNNTCTYSTLKYCVNNDSFPSNTSFLKQNDSYQYFLRGIHCFCLLPKPDCKTQQNFSISLKETSMRFFLLWIEYTNESWQKFKYKSDLDSQVTGMTFHQ